MVPFFTIFMLNDEIGAIGKQIALLIFCIASLTDCLDGYLARKYNLITNFGKFMDPLADKLLVCSALICLSSLGQLSPWVVLIIIAREFIISGFRLVASDNNIVIAASCWGKAKTVTQMIMIILLILDFKNEIFTFLADLSIVISVSLTIISLVDYIWKNKQVLFDGKM
jgi:CDP-diacylglycerol--glycerol-3-phosphate 3-phosphatidyltransferase